MVKLEDVRIMSGSELEAAIKADDRKIMCATLGTFIGAKSSAAEIVKKANLFLQAFEIRKQNWQALIEYYAPKAEEDLKKEAKTLVENLKKRNLTAEQIAEALKQLAVA